MLLIKCCSSNKIKYKNFYDVILISWSCRIKKTKKIYFFLLTIDKRCIIHSSTDGELVVIRESEEVRREEDIRAA